MRSLFRSRTEKFLLLILATVIILMIFDSNDVIINEFSVEPVAIKATESLSFDILKHQDLGEFKLGEYFLSENYTIIDVPIYELNYINMGRGIIVGVTIVLQGYHNEEDEIKIITNFIQNQNEIYKHSQRLASVIGQSGITVGATHNTSILGTWAIPDNIELGILEVLASSINGTMYFVRKAY